MDLSAFSNLQKKCGVFSVFLVDWFSFTSRFDSVKTVIDFLGLASLQWETVNGFYGYADRLYNNGISIHHNPRSEDMGILVEMSGHGCRAFETFSETNFADLFSFVCDSSDSYNVTRLDVAFDDKQGIIPIKKLEQDTRNQNFVSKFRKWGIEETSDGDTVYQGSKSSNIMLRIYDKAAERGVDGHWVRVELQLRQDLASEFLHQYVSGVSLGDIFCGVLYNYIRYVTPDLSDTNKWRWQMRKYWQKLIDKADKIRLFTRCDMEYNLMNLHNYVVMQAGGAVKTYIDILGYDKLQASLDERTTPLNAKYKRLLSEKKENEKDAC